VHDSRCPSSPCTTLSSAPTGPSSTPPSPPGLSLPCTSPSCSPSKTSLTSSPSCSLPFTLGFLYTGTLIFSHCTYNLTTPLAILFTIYRFLPSTLRSTYAVRIVSG
jgi:hypothetical protein